MNESMNTEDDIEEYSSSISSPLEAFETSRFSVIEKKLDVLLKALNKIQTRIIHVEERQKKEILPSLKSSLTLQEELAPFIDIERFLPSMVKTMTTKITEYEEIFNDVVTISSLQILSLQRKEETLAKKDRTDTTSQRKSIIESLLKDKHSQLFLKLAKKEQAILISRLLTRARSRLCALKRDNSEKTILKNLYSKELWWTVELDMWALEGTSRRRIKSRTHPDSQPLTKSPTFSEVIQQVEDGLKIPTVPDDTFSFDGILVPDPPSKHKRRATHRIRKQGRSSSSRHSQPRQISPGSHDGSGSEPDEEDQ
ncbi:hypothetical protein ADUPG1_006500 [Aduncisulcus paluster]|uniref:Uncharacterized protein n=1 Tax=Aduncisulcus paluster TaxID=2918883 RepID=A0ABQ5KLG8_9EUKA|nr:hypothetical protein ADUPG1_006500 [Aduncisulcus paluster]